MRAHERAERLAARLERALGPLPPELRREIERELDAAVRGRDAQWRAGLGIDEAGDPAARRLQPEQLEAWLRLREDAAARLAGEDEVEAKNRAYEERNRVVALLAALFPASLERDPAEPRDEWSWVVLIELPAGQVSWHFDADLLPLFAHVPRHAGRRWDGHTTEQKYDRVRQTIAGLRREPGRSDGG